ncbi:hypothetical protein JGH11_04225 [Dysgonomonas sp. Marseille-P4677]|uniref:hypothetical protein n=1 Tax=Dysgonomonas sp. Marseille-P4677 TaxID=2364790 RepID=UPI001912F2D8|nr:hypothetical protein [Dysgonomonas sp. Marseille-P4677]MBK5720072.1 hypothetical protein [Dysgonomonas sp. Marseille-P4677]
MIKNELTPLELLRQEKAIVRRECAEGEDRLAEHWVYLSNNASSLILQSVTNTVLRKFGFGHKEDAKEESSSSNSGFAQGLLSNLTTFYPVIWEIVQPLLFRFAIRKIKSIFSGKKKKRCRDYDD